MDHSKRNIALLFVSQAIAITSTITMVTYSALVAKMLTGSVTLATIPAALGLIAAALTAYPASMFMKKYGRRRGFQLGATFAMLAGILTFAGIFTGEFTLFCAGVTIHGIFQSFAAFYRFTAAEIAAPKIRKQAISYILAGGMLAALVAPTAARLFEEGFFLPIQYAGTYLLVILLSFLTLIILLFVKFPDIKPEKTHIEQHSRPPLWQVLKRPAFLCASLNAAGAYMAMSYVMTASPVQIVEYCGFQIADAASVIQWHVMAMYLPGFFTGSLIARFGAVKIILCGMFLLALSAGFAIQGIELINFYGALTLLGLGWNFMFTASTALLEEAHKPSEKAHIQGINDFIVFGLTALATLTSGYLLETFGWVNMNKIVFVMLAILLTITFWYILSDKKEYKNVP